MELFLLAAIIGGGLWFFSSQKAAATPPALPQDTKTPTAGPPPSTGCSFGLDKPIEQVDDTLRNAIMAALTVETDPKELDDFADQLDKICTNSPSAAAIRKKSAAIKTALGKEGLPPTADPSIISFPVPGVVGTSPEPLSKTEPPPTDSFEIISAEPATNPPAPAAGCQSLPTTQWWTGPYSKSGVGLTYLAEAITGNKLRYVELMAANPEKATVGNPTNPIDTGYSFVSLGEGERVRIPLTWNPLIDQTGDASGGSIWPICETA